MSVGMSRRVSHVAWIPSCSPDKRKEKARIDSRVTAVWLLAVSAGPDGLVGRMNGTGQDKTRHVPIGKYPAVTLPVIHCSLI
jgi:hypothetical protein